MGEFSVTLIGDSSTKVQPNGEKAWHRLVNELVTKLKRLTVMLQNKRNEVTAKRIYSGVDKKDGMTKLQFRDHPEKPLKSVLF